MVRNFDHITIVVRDVAAAKGFFALLGFKEIKSVVISGKIMEDYMGIKGIEADHITLAIETPHTEVQRLSYRHPELIADADATQTTPENTTSARMTPYFFLSLSLVWRTLPTHWEPRIETGFPVRSWQRGRRRVNKHDVDLAGTAEPTAG